MQAGSVPTRLLAATGDESSRFLLAHIAFCAPIKLLYWRINHQLAPIDLNAEETTG